MKSTYFCLAWVFLILTDAMVMKSSVLNSKIAFGENVKDHLSVQFMASIRLLIENDDPINWHHICGGCLISKQHVLTAAQCILEIRNYADSDLKKARIHFGLLSLSRATLIRNIKDLESHKKYHEDTVDKINCFDIGVILLVENVKTSNRIRPIDLFEYTDVPIQSGITMGLGSEKNWVPIDETPLRCKEMASTMKIISVTMMPPTDCVYKFMALRNVDPEKIICGYGRLHYRQVSVGDAGNPLIIRYENKKYVGGVTSYVPGSRVDKPNLFIRVDSHVKYIREAMARLEGNNTNCTSASTSENVEVITISD